MDIDSRLIISAIVALSGVIGFLYRQSIAQHAKTDKKLEDCEDSHKETSKIVLDLNGRLNKLEGEREGFHTGVELSVQRVIEEVRTLKNESK